MRGTVVLALALSTLSFDAWAITRYNTLTMSCAQVRAVLRQDGAAILSYGRPGGPPLYDRYVYHGGYCEGTEVPKAAFVPTSDTRACQILKCYEMSHIR